MIIDAKLPCRALFVTTDTDASLWNAAAFSTCRFKLFGIDMLRTGFGLQIAHIPGTARYPLAHAGSVYEFTSGMDT